MTAPNRPWLKLPHRVSEADGWIELIDPASGEVTVRFEPPEFGVSDEEFLRFLTHAARLAETERFGPS